VCPPVCCSATITLLPDGRSNLSLRPVAIAIVHVCVCVCNCKCECDCNGVGGGDGQTRDQTSPTTLQV
jgi:hypothetical protein